MEREHWPESVKRAVAAGLRPLDCDWCAGEGSHCVDPGAQVSSIMCGCCGGTGRNESFEGIAMAVLLQLGALTCSVNVRWRGITHTKPFYLESFNHDGTPEGLARALLEAFVAANTATT